METDDFAFLDVIFPFPFPATRDAKSGCIQTPSPPQRERHVPGACTSTIIGISKQSRGVRAQNKGHTIFQGIEDNALGCGWFFGVSRKIFTLLIIAQKLFFSQNSFFVFPVAIVSRHPHFLLLLRQYFLHKKNTLLQRLKGYTTHAQVPVVASTLDANKLTANNDARIQRVADEYAKQDKSRRAYDDALAKIFQLLKNDKVEQQEQRLGFNKSVPPTDDDNS
jgi:hypothetical protein